ncbi:MAG: protein-L-isoaspartate(D-aspartate) O-methyltransferase [Chitinophagaceae bacterium]
MIFLKQEDTYKHKGMRAKLIDELRKKGISNEEVLSAIMKIPRHFFLDPAFDKIAYQDRAFPIDEGQTISQPYTVAYQTMLLNVKSNEKVLEIGTGSAYQASVLAALNAKVYTIERQRKLFEKNIKSYPLKEQYKNIKFYFKDGYQGLITEAPFDKILITAATAIIPPVLIEQLKLNGIMVLPLGQEGKQIMTRITKLEHEDLQIENFGDFSFVPMLEGKN